MTSRELIHSVAHPLLTRHAYTIVEVPRSVAQCTFLPQNVQYEYETLALEGGFITLKPTEHHIFDNEFCALASLGPVSSTV